MPRTPAVDRNLFLILIVVCSLILLSPWHNFQEFLSQGDHGRDLYAGQAVLRGEMPYKNFWWVYGPLMPYVYGAFYLVAGAHITTLILSKLLWITLGAVFIYLTLTNFTTELMAFLAGIWFVVFHQDFFFTYNHAAGIATVLGASWCLAAYIKEGALRWAWGALGFIFLACLIKINFGLATLVLAIGCVAVRSWIFKESLPPKKFFYTFALLILPLLLFGIYAFFLHGLSVMEIRQCLPYLGDDQPYNTSPWLALTGFLGIIWQSMTSNWMNVSFAVLLWACIGWVCFKWINKQTPYALQLALIGFLSVSYVFNFHEFLKSGVWYRGFWAQPFSIMLSFAFIAFALHSAPAFIRKLVICFIIFMAAASWQTNMVHANQSKTQSQAFSLDGQTVYLTNQPAWIKTVRDTTSFLKTNLGKDELFLALPYDCLYYYLTDKPTPSRQLIFFDHIKIPADQEQRIIAELEAHKTNYVVVSSRAFARMEPGLGIFGKTYCPHLAAYIDEHFSPVARFGDWTNEPGWAWNHGTLILKRK